MRVRWLAGTEMDAGGRRAFSWMKGVLFSVIGIAIPAVMFLAGNGMPTGDFDPDEFFPARQESGSVPVRGKDTESVHRVSKTVDWLLSRADKRVATGLEQQGVVLYIIDNEEELESNPALLDFLLQSRPLELLYTNIEGTDETLTVHQGTVAQKLMQVFVYYPLELDPQYAEIKWDLEAAFSEACLPHEQIGGRPVYDPRDYSIPDEAHPHMGPPFYTALGAYLGLGYEVHFGLTHPLRDATEYYPITDEEMSRLDPILVEFLDKYMR